jgi:putative MATE family efflux protein
LSQRAVFTEGSTLRHVIIMTATGSVGLMAIFLVDLLSLLYVSWLGDEKLTAGVGYATTLLFFLTSVNIGFMIATTALTARRLGAEDKEGAREIAASTLLQMTILAAVVSLAAAAVASPVLSLLGAEGKVLAIAEVFLWITLPSNVLMALGMGFSGLLRAVGDANRAMHVTLAGGIVTAVLDPILIFGLGMGVHGAAIVTVFSRLAFALVGYHGAVRVHGLVGRPTLAGARRDLALSAGIAVPAILTNIATPFSLAVVTAFVARFGPWAIAANAIIDRLVPVAFGALFALSGAVGPILAQNWGAGRFDRMRGALRHAFIVGLVYVTVTWIILVLARHQIVQAFALTGPAAEGVLFFCWVSGPTWAFIGLLFTANAAFNNLGFPLYSTAFNWGRATLGTIPFAWLGAKLYGYNGTLVGIGLGAMVFGLAAAWYGFRTIGKLERANPPAADGVIAERTAGK